MRSLFNVGMMTLSIGGFLACFWRIFS